MAEQATQTAREQKPQPAAAMAEAGFSMNVKMVDSHGQEVQLTFRCSRASDSDRLISHYAATVDRLINAGWQATNAGARAAAGNGASDGAAPSCRIHGGQMKPSKKLGSFYCPRKLADGSYCAEKVEGGQG